MTLLLLAIAAGLWMWAEKTGNEQHRRIAALSHVVVAVGAAFLRGDVPPAGWAGALVLASIIPAIGVALRPGGTLATVITAPMGMLTLAIAVWSAAAPGPGVAMWTGWAGLHLTFAIAGVGAALAAALVALRRLQGRRLGLLVAACVVTLAPLTNDVAQTVQVYSNGEPASIAAPILDPGGDQGVVRTLPARVQLPMERPIRYAAGGAFLFALFFAIGGLKLGRIRFGVLAIAFIHVAWLASACIPRDLGVDGSALAEIARTMLLPELWGAETLGVLTLPAGPLTGGPGAPALLLPLALIALMLGTAALLDPLELEPKDIRAINQVEGWLVTFAAVCLAVGAAFGMVWSNYRWGGPIVPDPKIFAVMLTLGLYGLYFVARNALSATSSVTSWMVLAAMALLLLSMFGPELRWIAPSLHSFGA